MIEDLSIAHDKDKNNNGFVQNNKPITLALLIWTVNGYVQTKPSAVNWMVFRFYR